METIPAKITPKLLVAIDELIEEGWYANRSEFIRNAVRELIRKTKAERLESTIKEDVIWGING